MLRQDKVQIHGEINKIITGPLEAEKDDRISNETKSTIRNVMVKTDINVNARVIEQIAQLAQMFLSSVL